jgi:hypothetical protein
MIQYERIIAVKERASGNEFVGTEWIETASFDKETPISRIIEWAGEYEGRLMIAVDNNTVTNY